MAYLKGKETLNLGAEDAKLLSNFVTVDTKIHLADKASFTQQLKVYLKKGQTVKDMLADFEKVFGKLELFMGGA